MKESSLSPLWVRVESNEPVRKMEDDTQPPTTSFCLLFLLQRAFEFKTNFQHCNRDYVLLYSPN